MKRLKLMMVKETNSWYSNSVLVHHSISDMLGFFLSGMESIIFLTCDASPQTTIVIPTRRTIQRRSNDDERNESTGIPTTCIQRKTGFKLHAKSRRYSLEMMGIFLRLGSNMISKRRMHYVLYITCTKNVFIPM